MSIRSWPARRPRANGFDRPLLTDMNGFVAEGPGANLFFEKNGKLYTPATGNILPGITRATVFELCGRLGIPFEEGQFTSRDLQHADAAFFCGTIAEGHRLGIHRRQTIPHAMERHRRPPDPTGLQRLYNSRMKLNKYSRTLTQDTTQPAAQAMLYGIGFKDEDFAKAQVGIASMGYDGNTSICTSTISLKS